MRGQSGMETGSSIFVSTSSDDRCCGCSYCAVPAGLRVDEPRAVSMEGSALPAALGTSPLTIKQ